MEVENIKKKYEWEDAKIIYHIKCYLTPKGLKTKKDTYRGKIEGGSWIVFTTEPQSFPKSIISLFKIHKKKVSLHAYETKTNDDLIFTCESWCEKKNYKKARQNCIDYIKDYIHLAMNNVLKEEKKLEDYKKRFDNYKKSVELFNNEIKISQNGDKSRN